MRGTILEVAMLANDPIGDDVIESHSVISNVYLKRF